MIVGVMAGSKVKTAEGECLARQAGALIASLGFNLLTGGGLGLMAIVGTEFLNTRPRTGKLISILRAAKTDHLDNPWDQAGDLVRAGLPEDAFADESKIKLFKDRPTGAPRTWQPNEDNELAEITIRTHLPYSGKKGTHDLSRNHINILTSDLIVVLPGDSGTDSELRLAVQYANKPILLFLGAGTVGEEQKNAKQLKGKFKKRVTIVPTKEALGKLLSKFALASPGAPIETKLSLRRPSGKSQAP